MTEVVGGSPGEIKALTSLRGLAALAVVLTHFSATFEGLSAGWLPSLVPHGYMAVDFFFVLSGFIMSYTYLAAFEGQGMRAYGPFLVKRVARIVPLGLAVTALILALAAVAGWWGRADLFLNRQAVEAGLAASVAVNVLHLQGLLNAYNLNDPSWSISLEFIAYLLFPLLILLIFRSRAACAATVLAGTAVLLVAALSQPRLGLGFRTVPYDLGRCLSEFCYGMLVYRLYRAGGRLRVLGEDRWTWAVSALGVGMLFVRVDLLAALAFPWVVLAWAWNTGRASRIMSLPLPYFFGTISFSLYLVHHLFRRPEVEALYALFPERLPPVAVGLLVVAGAFSVVPLATLAYYGVERPGRTAINALVRRWRRPVRGPAVPAA